MHYIANDMIRMIQYEDAEIAFRRAADLKPDLPPPWKVHVLVIVCCHDLMMV